MRTKLGASGAPRGWRGDENRLTPRRHCCNV